MVYRSNLEHSAIHEASLTLPLRTGMSYLKRSSSSYDKIRFGTAQVEPFMNPQPMLWQPIRTFSTFGHLTCELFALKSCLGSRMGHDRSFCWIMGHISSYVKCLGHDDAFDVESHVQMTTYATLNTLKGPRERRMDCDPRYLLGVPVENGCISQAARGTADRFT